MPAATRLDDLTIEELSGVDHPAHLHEGWLVLKNATGLSDEDLAGVVEKAKRLSASTDDPPPSRTETAPSAEDEADLGMSQSPSEEAPVADETPRTDAPVEGQDDVAKAVAPDVESVRKERDEAVEKAARLQKQVDDLATVIKAERDARLDREAVEKAQDWRHVPGLVPSEFGPTFRKLADVDPDGAAKVAELLKAASAALSESELFKAAGSPAAPVSNAETEAEAKARELAKSTGKSFEQAFVEVLSADPSLYARHEQERGA